MMKTKILLSMLIVALAFRCQMEGLLHLWELSIFIKKL